MLRIHAKKLSGMNLDYIAGFFDGEGSVSIIVGGLHRKRPDFRYGFSVTAKIAMSQKDPAILHEIRNCLGYGFVSGRNLIIKRHAEIERFLEEVGSRCSVKRPQIDLLKSAIRHFANGSYQHVPKNVMLARLDCLEKMRGLNKFRNVKMWNISQLRDRVINFNDKTWHEHRHIQALKGWDKRERKKTRLSPDLLRELYNRDLLTQQEIGKRFGCCSTTVSSFMREHDIPRRGGWAIGSLDRTRATPELIRELYRDERLTMEQIAARFGCSESAVLSFMRRNGITRRIKSEAMRFSYQARNASSTPTSKASKSLCE